MQSGFTPIKANFNFRMFEFPLLFRFTLFTLFPQFSQYSKFEEFIQALLSIQYFLKCLLCLILFKLFIIIMFESQSIIRPDFIIEATLAPQLFMMYFPKL